MKWSQVRTAYPNQWLVIEALEAHSQNSQRILDRVSVVETCSEGANAFQCYRRLHQEFPFRELYYVHMSRETLDIRERHWVGIRSDHAAYAQG